jgi:hypothetical protein
LYSLWFFDYDGFENGGFFSNKNMSIARDGIEAPLAVSLYRERQAVVIRGTVLAKETGKPLSRIKVSIQSRDGESGIYSLSAGFEVLSDHEGQFYIQVPERDTYVIDFFDTNSLFQWKALRLTSDEIKDPLQVDLEQIPREETGKNGE